VVVEQIEGGNPKPAQHFPKAAFLGWATKLRRKHPRSAIHAVYEACGFGFGLQRQLSALGISCYVVCPQKLDERQQRVKTDGGNQQLVQGSSTWSAYPCDQGKTSVIFAVSSTHPKLDFRPGRGKVRARIENYQPGVQPADITTRVRIVADER